MKQNNCDFHAVDRTFSLYRPITVLGKEFNISRTDAMFLFVLSNILIFGKKALNVYDDLDIKLYDEKDELWDYLHEKIKD